MDVLYVVFINVILSLAWIFVDDGAFDIKYSPDEVFDEEKRDIDIQDDDTIKTSAKADSGFHLVHGNMQNRPERGLVSPLAERTNFPRAVQELVPVL